MEKIKSGEFRADLFYRLNVFPVTLPPLRERVEDILPLSEHFVSQMSAKLGLSQDPGLSANARKQLSEYSYPGNVRELKNIIERSVLLSDFETISNVEFGEQVPEAMLGSALSVSTLSASHDSAPNNTPRSEDSHTAHNAVRTQNSDNIPQESSLKEAVGNYERTVILDCLQACNWQTKRVAEQLALPLSTLNHKMRKYELTTSD